MIINYCLFAIAKLYSRLVLSKLTNENSAIFRTVEINYKKTREELFLIVEDHFDTFW